MVAVPLAMFGGQAFAKGWGSDVDFFWIDASANITLTANTDNRNITEGVFLYSNWTCPNATLSEQTNGNATLAGTQNIYLTSPITKSGLSTTTGINNTDGLNQVCAANINEGGSFSTQIGGAGASTVTLTSGSSSIVTPNSGNTITANSDNGTNSINGRTNNIGTTGTSTNVVGNTASGTTVTATGGNSALSI